MDHNWERAAEILNSTRPYLRYLLLPFGVYAANRLISAILPGAHHQPKLDLRGRVVLITGASSGLGEQLAVTFYKYGAKVIITARSIDKLKEICADLKALPNVNNPYEPVYKYLDICDPNGIDEILSLLPEQKVDVLVNNAGLSMRGNCEDTPMNIHRQVRLHYSLTCWELFFYNALCKCDLTACANRAFNRISLHIPFFF